MLTTTLPNTVKTSGTTSRERWEMLCSRKNNTSQIDLNTLSEIDEDGTSAFWQAACELSDNEEEGAKLIELFDHLKSHLNLNDLLTLLTTEPNLDEIGKGHSAFWWLATAVIEGTPKPFLAVFSYLKDKLSAAQWYTLLSTTQANGNVLFCLADAADSGHGELFISVFSYLQDKFSAEQWYTLLSQSYDKEGYFLSGQSAFYILSNNNGCKAHFVFAEVFECLKNKLSVKQWYALLSQEAKCDEIKDRTAFSNLVGEVHFEKVFLYFKDKFTYQEWYILLSHQFKCDEPGYSAFYFLAAGTTNLKSDVQYLRERDTLSSFKVVFFHMKEALIREEWYSLLSREINETEKTAFYRLANSKAKNDTDAFQVVLSELKDTLTAEQWFTLLSKKYPHDPSSICHLAQAAEKSEPEALQAVFVELKQRLKTKQWYALLAQQWEGQTVFSMLVCGATKHVSTFELLKKILQHLSGEIPTSLLKAPTREHKSVEGVLEELADLMKLINEKNTFSRLLNTLKQNNHTQNDEVKLLFAAAEKAQNAGYLNAYYEVIKYLFRRESLDERLMDALTCLSPISDYKQVAIYQLGHAFYIKATTTHSMLGNIESNYYLMKAAELALTLDDLQLKGELLANIVQAYLSEGKPAGLLSPEEMKQLIETLKEQESIISFINVLKAYKEARSLKNENSQLKRKLRDSPQAELQNKQPVSFTYSKFIANSNASLKIGEEDGTQVKRQLLNRL